MYTLFIILGFVGLTICGFLWAVGFSGPINTRDEIKAEHDATMEKIFPGRHLK